MTNESVMQVKAEDVLVTDAVVQVFRDAYQAQTGLGFYRKIIAAVLAHIANNPRELTDAEARNIWDTAPLGNAISIVRSITQQYARMQFLKPVEEEPAELKALLISIDGNGLTHAETRYNEGVRAAWKACEAKMRGAK